MARNGARPDTSSPLVLTLIGGAGLLALWEGYRGAARTLFVSLQLPWLVSGGMLGVTLLLVAAGVGGVYVERREHALRSRQDEQLLAEALRLAGGLERYARAGAASEPAPMPAAARRTPRARSAGVRPAPARAAAAARRRTTS